MKRPLLFQICLCLALIVGCSPSNLTETEWPGKHSEVRAYVYNLENEGSARVLNGKHLSKDVYYPNGVLLNATQEQMLKVAVTGKHTDHAHAGCYVPHHAFVFYDANKKPVGTIEICFECLNYTAWPKGLPDTFDIGSLRQLVLDLGLPVLKRLEDYEALKSKSKSVRL